MNCLKRLKSLNILSNKKLFTVKKTLTYAAFCTVLVIISSSIYGCAGLSDDVTTYSLFKNKAKWSNHYLEVKYSDDTFAYKSEDSPYIKGTYVSRHYESDKFPGYLVTVHIDDKNKTIGDNYVLSVKRKEAAAFVKEIISQVIPNNKVYLTNDNEPVDFSLDINVSSILYKYKITVLTPQVVKDRDLFERQLADACKSLRVSKPISITVYEGVSLDISLNNENEILSFFSAHKQDFTDKFSCFIDKDGYLTNTEWLDNNH